MRQAGDEPAFDRIGNLHKNDWYVMGLLLQRLHRKRSGGKNRVRFKVHELDHIFLYARRIGIAPAIVDVNVAVICPTHCFKCFSKRREIGASFWIALDEST